MLNTFNATLYISMLLQGCPLDSQHLNGASVEPYIINRLITNEDMYDLDSLIEKVFMQEEGS